MANPFSHFSAENERVTSGYGLTDNPFSRFGQPKKTDAPRNEGLIGDTADLLQKGIYEAIGGVGQFGETFLGVGEDLRDWAREKADAQLQELSPETLEAYNKEIISSEDNELWGEGASDFRTWYAHTLEMIGLMGLPIPGGAALTGVVRAGMGINKAAKALQASRAGRGLSFAQAKAQVLKDNRAKDWISTTLGYGGAEAAVGAGATGSGARLQVLQTPVENLADSQAFQAYIQSGMSPEAAREALANDVADTTVHGATLPTMLLGAGAGRIYDDMLRGFGKSRVANMLKGAGTEALEEAPQSAFEQMASNYATQRHIDPSQEITEGIGKAALEGGIFGGILGGGVGAVMPAGGRDLDSTPGPTPDPVRDLDNANNVGDAIDAATRIAFGPNEGPPPPTPGQLRQRDIDAAMLEQQLGGPYPQVDAFPAAIEGQAPNQMPRFPQGAAPITSGFLGPRPGSTIPEPGDYSDYLTPEERNQQDIDQTETTPPAITPPIHHQMPVFPRGTPSVTGWPSIPQAEINQGRIAEAEVKGLLSPGFQPPPGGPSPGPGGGPGPAAPPTGPAPTPGPTEPPGGPAAPPAADIASMSDEDFDALLDEVAAPAVTEQDVVTKVEDNIRELVNAPGFDDRAANTIGEVETTDYAIDQAIRALGGDPKTAGIDYKAVRKAIIGTEEIAQGPQPRETTEAEDIQKAQKAFAQFQAERLAPTRSTPVKETPKQKYQREKQVDTKADSLLIAIAKTGGINIEELASDLDIDDLKRARGWKIMRPFHKGKRSDSLDGMRERLAGYGYNYESVNDLIEAIRTELAGNKQYSVEGGTRQLEEQAQEREESAEAQALAEQPPYDESDPFGLKTSTEEDPFGVIDEDYTEEENAESVRLAALYNEALDLDEAATDEIWESGRDSEAVAEQLAALIEERKNAVITQTEGRDQAEGEAEAVTAEAATEAESGQTAAEPGSVTPATAKDNSVQDHTQTAHVNEKGNILVSSFVGLKKTAVITIFSDEWAATEKGPTANPSYNKSELIRNYTQDLDEQPGGPEQAERIRDAMISAIDKAVAESKKPPETDLLGQDTTQAQAVADKIREKDAKRSPAGERPAEAQSGDDLFAGGGKLEPDLFDQAATEAQTTANAKPLKDIKLKETYDVEGEEAVVLESADQLLVEADTRISVLQQLRDCLTR